MPCMSDVILINLLSVLIFIYHFAKIIFTEQAGLPTFFPQGKTTLMRIHRKVCKQMLFLLNILWRFYGLGLQGWLTCLPDTVLASLVSTYADTVTPEDASLFSSGRETLFPPKFSCSYWSPKGWPCPFFFFSLLSLSQEACFSYNRVGGHLRDPPRTISISNPIPSTMNKYPGTELRPLRLRHSQSECPVPQQCFFHKLGATVSHLGWRVGDEQPTNLFAPQSNPQCPFLVSAQKLVSSRNHLSLCRTTNMQANFQTLFIR